MTAILAPAKVNLCLYLGPTRVGDGRHELVTVFDALSLADVLRVEAGVQADEVVCPGVSGPNLATRALALLREAGWSAPPVRITIEKRIPVAAGMGGGSSDAAAVLGLAHARTPEIDVRAIARRLGADVSVLIEPGVWMATGAGDDELTRSPAGIASHAYVVVPAPVPLSTPEVFAEADRLGLPRGTSELEALVPAVRAALFGAQDRPFPPELIVNDLAPAAISLCPSIAGALGGLVEAGADQAIVSGSGPTAVGIWWGEGCLTAAQAAARALCERFPGAQAALPFASPSQSAVIP